MAVDCKSSQARNRSRQPDGRWPPAQPTMRILIFIGSLIPKKISAAKDVSRSSPMGWEATKADKKPVALQSRAVRPHLRPRFWQQPAGYPAAGLPIRSPEYSALCHRPSAVLRNGYHLHRDVAIVDSQLHFAHVGDSRLYHIRGGTISRLTRDHSFVGRLVENGLVRSEDAEFHPQRHILTAALGPGSKLSRTFPIILSRWKRKIRSFFVPTASGGWSATANWLKSRKPLRPRRPVPGWWKWHSIAAVPTTLPCSCFEFLPEAESVWRGTCGAGMCGAGTPARCCQH